MIANQDKWQGLMKEHARLEPIIERYQEYKKSEQAIADSKEMLGNQSRRRWFRSGTVCRGSF